MTISIISGSSRSGPPAPAPTLAPTPRFSPGSKISDVVQNKEHEKST